MFTVHLKTSGRGRGGGQPGEQVTAWVVVPDSRPVELNMSGATVIWLLCSESKAFQLTSAIGAVGIEERVGTLAAPTGRLRLNDGTALSVVFMDFL